MDGLDGWDHDDNDDHDNDDHHDGKKAGGGRRGGEALYMLTPDHPPPAELTGNNNLRVLAPVLTPYKPSREG